MQPPSANPSSPMSDNATPDFGTACPPKRYITPFVSWNSAEIRRALFLFRETLPTARATRLPPAPSTSHFRLHSAAACQNSYFAHEPIVERRPRKQFVNLPPPFTASDDQRHEREVDDCDADFSSPRLGTTTRRLMSPFENAFRNFS